MTKPYTRKQRATAVATADALNSTEAAAERLGIPGRTIRRWQADPEMAEYVQKTRDELADDIRAAAALAWSSLVARIRSGDIETRDLIIAAGVAIDKAQLLSGGATARTETRALTEGLDDHEKRALRDAIDEWIAERTAADGAEVAAG